jgi:hypothetical protein
MKRALLRQKNASLPLKPTRQAVAPVCFISVPNWLKNGLFRPYNSMKLHPDLSAMLKCPAECRLKWDGFF